MQKKSTIPDNISETLAEIINEYMIFEANNPSNLCMKSNSRVVYYF